MDDGFAEAWTRRQLASLPRRLAHVASVADLAVDVSLALGLDAQVVTSAAWLHDIGYAPSIAKTGLHSLDGARFLRDEGADERVVNLVAHHSHAVFEAELRRADQALLEEFPFDDSLPHDELCFCDMTTGPDGRRTSVHERLAEIRCRYGPDDVVSRFITKAGPAIAESVQRVSGRLAAAAQSK